MNRAIDRKFRTTVMCVDTFDQDGVMKGRIYNPYLKGEIKFGSMMQFIQTIEELLDTMNFPMAYEEKRTFKPKGGMEMNIQEGIEDNRGKKATFEIKILFRQNASWQGTVTWLESDVEESFRSALELFVLINSALVTE
ncbi:MAG: hypothetical protein K6A30_04565 [Lachnospiraceae bacterium]|nr:hypothetical protein [Lachnospiraceae bacterium]